jgi:hypothetical protein
MMKKISFFNLIIAFICFPICASPPLFLERESASALLARDGYYNKNGVTSLLFPFQPLDFAGAESLTVKLQASSSDSESPWYNLLAGFSVLKSSPDSIPVYFGRAVDAAGNDLGIEYALSMEFGRCQQPFWEQRCLERVRKLFLASGAQSSVLISQSLLNRAMSAEKNGDYSSASLYNTWSTMFDRDMLWPTLRKIFKAIPFHLSIAYNECLSIVTTIGKSWPLQLSSLLVLFLWVRQWIVFIVLGLFITLGIMYGPPALHRINHLFPSAVSPRLKTYFSIVLFLSLIAFGVLPFLWVLACLMWRHCSKKDKWITAVCCILLVLFPLSVRFEDMLRSGLSPEGTLSLFKKSVDDGYYGDLDNVIRKHASLHENDYLAQAAAALYAAKGNDITYALSAIQKARSLRSNDPVVLLIEGNVDFLAGAFEKAKNTFETCIKQFPEYAPAYFNCGQYYLGTVETIKGMECIDRATKLDPQAINSFIKVNDESFSKKWPRLRQLMPPEYNAMYFWKNVFPRYWGSLSTADTLWGAYFWGVPIAGCCIISLLIVMLLILLDVFVWSGDRVQKIFLCKLCGAAMCRQCKRGVVCSDCYEVLHQIRNENIRQHIIEKILVRNKRIKHCFSYGLDVVFPGCGMAYYAVDSRLPGFCFITLTSVVYATLFSIHFLSYTYPFWIAREIVLPLYMILPVYNLIFAFRAIIKSRNEFRT